jgi:hypothetical protein
LDTVLRYAAGSVWVLGITKWIKDDAASNGVKAKAFALHKMGKSGIFFQYYTAMVTGGEAVQATSVKNEQRKEGRERENYTYGPYIL